MLKSILTRICFLVFTVSAKVLMANGSDSTIILPLGGNAWVNSPAVITDTGVSNWSEQGNVPVIYFRITKPQQLDLSLKLQVPSGKSRIKVTIGEKEFIKQVSATSPEIIHVGSITPGKGGYIKAELHGIHKTGPVFANVSEMIISGVHADNEVIYVKNGSSFYFCRRGPSVHLNFHIPENLKNDVRWFYSEISVPLGMDKEGSYFMADGFSQGYFGMQVNSKSERRILFSVWSPFETENPESIPDSMKIRLLKKGPTVHAQDFGNEGSGGQSFMRYSWEAGKTYGFLLGAEPDTAAGSTIFTAYFKDLSLGKWFLVARFERPKTLSYLSQLHSFLENFIPENGNLVRIAYYKNQWIAGKNGEWHELNQITLTADAAARNKLRADYAGGTKDGQFYLMNCGFFDQFIPFDQVFERPLYSEKPIVDFNKLP
ncbi:uncharacterized protein DUF5077 [Arcticibacter tournemirensis]|uniref:DUF3472 domain-containing protein n=1 Tax=Arcticibacter tournemirensis TaxID=699437 RepID=A0A5M9HAP0_9SPHI|nr:DUF3472 domain-containing protein [Arcticibacter tournemirensis]KAA8484052.1 DUF3472 domain-containing protein [Arcticibacter tournemirensis]TQM51785.1 uncharacterized protein DUF5077 [Arcticibacter tournemirensis]